MVTKLAATVIDGTLVFEEPLQLPNKCRVTVTIQIPDAVADCHSAFKAFQKYANEHPVDSGGQRFTRDELHERH